MSLNENDKRPRPDSPSPKLEKIEPKEGLGISQGSQISWSSSVPYAIMPSKSSQYKWILYENATEIDRVIEKEFASEQAQLFCKKLLDTISLALKDVKPGSGDAVVMGHRIIKKWVQEHEEIIDRQHNFKVLVGVEGPTGAGKSSFLGSLLRIEELLPSGQESAATAASAQVSWNFDNRPGYEYRAEITIRKRDEIERELKMLLAEIRRSQKILDSPDYEDEYSRDQDYAAARCLVDHEIPKVTAVWDLKEKDLDKIAAKCDTEAKIAAQVKQIITSNKAVFDLINEHTRCINSSDQKELARVIKPFLDSTKTNLAKDQKAKQPKTKSFKPWPLVKTVKIFVKSQILRTGINLVDLPGCGDAIHSRAEIAKKFRESFDIRMIVTPVCRATDEEEGKTLMKSGYEEVQMRLNGRLNQRGLCVVLSKTDDINPKTYISGSPDLQSDAKFMTGVARFKAIPLALRKHREESKTLKDKLRELKKATDKAVAEFDAAVTSMTGPVRGEVSTEVHRKIRDLKQAKNSAMEAYNKASEAFGDRLKTRKDLRAELGHLENKIQHHVIHTRNMYVHHHIHEDFVDRVIRNDQNAEIDTENEGKCWLPVLPVSTKAFWAVVNGEKHVVGFPREIYTGIPAVEYWLHRATIGHRDKHLSGLLTRFHVLMEKMRCYSQEQCGDLSVGITKSGVEASLDETHDKFHQKFNEMFDHWNTQIQAIDPLTNRDEAIKHASFQARRIARRWSYKYPKKLESTEKIHWLTYRAIIRREGGRFVNKSKNIYNWLEDLATPLLEHIAKDWNEQMNRYLPSLNTPMMRQFSLLWSEYLQNLVDTIAEEAPQLTQAFSSLGVTLQNMHRTVEVRIGEILDELSKEATEIHPQATKFLKTELSPIFRRALEICHKGSFEARQKLINEEVNKRIKRGCQKVMDGIQKELDLKKREMPKKFEKLALRTIKYVKRQVGFLLNNLLENEKAGSEIQERKEALQGKIRDILTEWEESWCIGQQTSDHILTQDHSIPKQMDESAVVIDDDYDSPVE